MIWLTWRQFRTQAWVTVAVLAAAAVAAILERDRLAGLTVGTAAVCVPGYDCGRTVFIVHAGQVGPPGGWTGLGLVLTYLLPPLIGAVWGAPLVAREFEAGTHRLVWNQSVTPLRWLTVKLATLGTAAMALTGVCAALVSRAGQHGELTRNRIQPLLFTGQGVAPVAYAAFAFALGVAAGAVFRRTLPAVAVTLAGYAAALFTMADGVRGHLLTPKTDVTPVTADNVLAYGITGDGSRIFLRSDTNLSGAWVLETHTTDAAGRPFTGALGAADCDGKVRGCLQWIADQQLQQHRSYQPGSRFWALQFTEAGIYLAAVALLIGFTYWWLRRRRA
jgi:hypothetical protein